MRIGIDARFIDSAQKTGVANYMTSLISCLPIIDQENTYILYFNSLRRKAEEFPGPLAKNVIRRVIRFPSFNTRYFNLIWLVLLEKRMRKDKIDVAHFMVSAFPPRTSLKTVSTIHDLSLFRLPDIKSRLQGDLRFFESMVRRAARGADRIIAVSEMTKNDIVHFFPFAGEKVDVVYLGIERNGLAFFDEDIRVFKKEKGLGKINILSVGSFEKRKNIETLISAFARLKQEAFQGKLVLVGGDGSASASIHALIDRLNLRNDIVMPGYVTNEDLLKYYKASDVLVFPSLYEGFGLPCIEAMQMGIPLITSNIPVFQELAGPGGLYFDPTNVDDLGEKICVVLNNHSVAESLIANGKDRAKLFTEENTARGTLDVYKKAYCAK